MELRKKGEPFGGLKVDLKPLKQRSKQDREAAEKEDAALAGSKRLRLEAFNAVKKENIANNVENAFFKRPYSPKNYRIYSDK